MPTRFIRGPWRPRTGIAFSAERDEHVMYTLRRTRLIATMGWIAASFAFWPTSAAFAADEISFEPAIGFFQLPEGYLLGRCSAVATNSKGEVYLLHRGRNPVICVDASGKFLRSWDNEHLGTPHGLRVDRDDNVWVTDIGRHRVLKFDPTGELLLVLGTGKPGAAGDEFNQPTDIAFAADGSVYVSDGYGNSRVLKFTAAGRLIKTWGTRGDKRGEFNLPHAIVVDAPTVFLSATAKTTEFKSSTLMDNLWVNGAALRPTDSPSITRATCLWPMAERIRCCVWMRPVKFNSGGAGSVKLRESSPCHTCWPSTQLTISSSPRWKECDFKNCSGSKVRRSPV